MEIYKEKQDQKLVPIYQFKLKFELTFKPMIKFQFKFNAWMDNTTNEFGFRKLSFQATAFI